MLASACLRAHTRAPPAAAALSRVLAAPQSSVSKPPGKRIFYFILAFKGKRPWQSGDKAAESTAADAREGWQGLGLGSPKSKRCFATQILPGYR